MKVTRGSSLQKVCGFSSSQQFFIQDQSMHHHVFLEWRRLYGLSTVIMCPAGNYKEIDNFSTPNLVSYIDLTICQSKTVSCFVFCKLFRLNPYVKVFVCGNVPNVPDSKDMFDSYFPISEVWFQQRQCATYHRRSQCHSTGAKQLHPGTSVVFSPLGPNREGFGVGSERDAVGQSLGVLVWLHCLVHGLSCFFKNNWGWSERSRICFFKFLSTADPRIKACSWSCASYKLRHLLPLVVANC